MINWQLLAQYLKELRINKGWTQAKLAREIGVAHYAIYHLETNVDETISIKRLIKVCKPLDINVSDLLFLCKSEKTLPDDKEIKQRLLIYYKLDKDARIDWKEIRIKIKQTMIYKDYTIHKLCRELELTSQRIYQIIKDSDRPMRLSTLKRVCRALEIDMDELMENHKIYSSKDVE